MRRVCSEGRRSASGRPLVARGHGARRATAWVAVVLALALAVVPAPASAASWGAISPGTSTVEAVRGRYGQPSRESQKKVEGYDTIEWVYEGQRAPNGIIRMTVEFGLLTPQGYKGNVVRVLQLEPRPGIFARDLVVDGWGVPERIAAQGDRDVFLYESGLVVTFDKEGISAVSMVFMLPQKVAPAGPGAAPQPSAAPTPPRR